MNIRFDLRILRWKQIKWALEETRGNQRAAARLVNIPPATFDRWMRELQLQKFAEELRAQKIQLRADRAWLSSFGLGRRGEEKTAGR